MKIIYLALGLLFFPLHVQAEGDDQQIEDVHGIVQLEHDDDLKEFEDLFDDDEDIERYREADEASAIYHDPSRWELLLGSLEEFVIQHEWLLRAYAQFCQLKDYSLKYLTRLWGALCSYWHAHRVEREHEVVREP